MTFMKFNWICKGFFSFRTSTA